MDATVNGVIGDAELDWSDDRKLRFIAQNVVDALAPANAPFINPEVLKETIDSGGRNFVRGVRHFARDIREPPRLPANVDVSKFAVGRNLGLSPGAVVLRDEPLRAHPVQAGDRGGAGGPDPPRTADDQQVLHLDLAPGRSHIEHLVGRASRCSRSPGATRARSIATGGWTRTPTR